MTPEWKILTGDARSRLKGIPTGTFHVCVTSPPYWGLRDYGVEGQLGMQESLEGYVQALVEIFKEVKRVLRDDGILWLNMGDSYVNHGSGPQGSTGRRSDRTHTAEDLPPKRGDALKPKDLAGVPWRVAFALQEDGWWVRNDVIWSKPNPMPYPAMDRCVNAHEHLFLLTKSQRYHFDHVAIREPLKHSEDDEGDPGGRNKRDVWEVSTKPFPEAHFAVYPDDLIEPCIKSGSSPEGACSECGTPLKRVIENRCGGEAPVITPDRKQLHAETYSRHRSRIPGGQSLKSGREVTKGWEKVCGCCSSTSPCRVLDPFCGSGTTGVVALRNDCSFTGIDLSPDYAEMAANRIEDDLRSRLSVWDEGHPGEDLPEHRPDLEAGDTFSDMMEKL